jgi:hypothetical protein
MSDFGSEKPKVLSVLLKTLVIFYTIVAIVWIGFAWGDKRRLYSSENPLRQIGETYPIEITLIRDDREHLACASTHSFSGLHCAYKSPNVAWSDGLADDTSILRPYSTVEGEQLLAAGLWSQLAPQEPLPSHRFSVLCNFRPIAAVRDARVRWKTNGAFGPINRAWLVGSLTNCVLPK